MADTTDYVPPKVWVWNKGTGGRFANINRPIAGPTHDKELPVGKHPLQLYSLGTPNGVKVTILLEELLAAGHKGAEYDAWLIKIGDGDQFGSGFVEVNPNSKIPALMDRSGATPIRVFETGAILLHLAEKFGAFMPKDTPRPRRVPVVAVLADGQRALSRRRLRPFLCLRADQDRIRHRPLRDGDQAPARRARPAPRRGRVCRGRLHHRRHRDLPVVRALGARRRHVQQLRRVPVGARIQACPALGGGDRRAAGGEARTHGQPRVRRPVAASSTSATTPATSRPRRRTRSRPRRNNSVYPFPRCGDGKCETPLTWRQPARACRIGNPSVRRSALGRGANRAGPAADRNRPPSRTDGR